MHYSIVVHLSYFRIVDGAVRDWIHIGIRLILRVCVEPELFPLSYIHRKFRSISDYLRFRVFCSIVLIIYVDAVCIARSACQRSCYICITYSMRTYDAVGVYSRDGFI